MPRSAKRGKANAADVLASLDITRYFRYKPKVGHTHLDLDQFQPRMCRTVAELSACDPLLPITLLKADTAIADPFFSCTSYSYLGGVTFSKLQQLFHSLDEKHHIFCSIVLDKFPVHLFFDFDLALNLPADKRRPGEAELEQAVAGQAEQVIDEFMLVFAEFFRTVFHREPDLSEMQWETACNPSKFSLHSHIITEAFVDIEHMNRFMSAFRAFLEDRCRQQGNSRLCVQADRPADIIDIDHDDEEASEAALVESEAALVESEAALVESEAALVESEAATLVETFAHVLDFGIYSRNRNFRLIHCRKPGKAKLTHMPRHDRATRSDAELLFRSMPSYSIAVGAEQLLTFNNVVKTHAKAPTGPRPERPLVEGSAAPHITAIVQRLLQADHILGRNTQVDKCLPQHDTDGVTWAIYGECARGTARCPTLSRPAAPHIHRNTVMCYSMTRHRIKVWDFKCDATGTNSKHRFDQVASDDDLNVLFANPVDVAKDESRFVIDITELKPKKKRALAGGGQRCPEAPSEPKRRRVCRRTAAETVAMAVLDQMVACLHERRTKSVAERKHVIWCIRGSGGDEELAEKFLRRCPDTTFEEGECVDMHWSKFRSGRGWNKAKLLAMLKLDLGEDEYLRRWQQWKPDENAEVETHQGFDAGLRWNTPFLRNLLPLLHKDRFTDPVQLKWMITLIKQVGGELSWLTSDLMLWLAGDPSYNEAAANEAWGAVQIDPKQRGSSWQKLRGFLASDTASLQAEEDFYKDNMLFHSEGESLACSGNAGLSALFVAQHKDDIKINKGTIVFYEAEQSKSRWTEYSHDDLSGLMTRALLPLIKQHRDRASFDKANSYSAAHTKMEGMLAPDPMLARKLDKLRDAVSVLEGLAKDGQIVRNIIGSQHLRDEMFVGQLNKKARLLPIKGGKVVELDTKKVRDRTREDMFTTECPFTYIPPVTASGEEECEQDPRLGRPNVTRFINKYWPDDLDMHLYMQTTLGYAITGDTSERMAFFWIGKTGAGKTTLMKMVELSLGNVFFASIRPEVIMKIGAKRNPAAPTPELMCLVYARVASVSETEPGAKIEEDFFKRSVGNGDVMCVRGMFQGAVYFIPMFTPIVYSNDPPLFDANVVGVANKIQVVPFEIQFVIDDSLKNREATKDVNQSENQAFVDEMMANHLDEFASWMVDGAYLYFKAKRDKLAKAWKLPQLVEERTDKYKTVEVNPFEKFLHKKCRLGTGLETVRAELQAGYKQWCADEGLQLSANQIKEACENRFEVDRVRSEKATAARPAGYYYTGVALLDGDGEIKAKPKANTVSTTRTFWPGPPKRRM